MRCPMCGQPARAMTTEERREGEKRFRVYVYHHADRQHREFEEIT